MQHTGQFEDESDGQEIETWTAADEGDMRYDLWAEDQADRHNWPGNADTRLMALAGGSYEDDHEMARRRAMIRREAA